MDGIVFVVAPEFVQNAKKNHLNAFAIEILLELESDPKKRYL